MTDRAAREAAREAWWAEADRRDAEQAARDAAITRALAYTDRLPGRVGDVVRRLFEELEPVRMDDGYLSYPVIGCTADVLVDLAKAITELDDEGHTRHTTNEETQHG
jgi:hypothetical protein